MQIGEARRILGLGPEEDPRPHLVEFRHARERVAEMIRTAPNETIALRYQAGLVELDQAIAAVREHLEVLGLWPPDPPAQAQISPEVSVAPILENVIPVGTLVAAPEIQEEEEAPKPRKLAVIAGTFLLLIAAAGIGAWGYLKIEDDKRLDLKVRLVALEREGGRLIDERRWPEAAQKFLEIETLQPDSEIAKVGRRSIEAGMVEEQNQLLAYWTGEARAALDASRWDDAEKAVRQVLDRYPKQEEAAAILDEIRIGRETASLNLAVEEARAFLDAGEWDVAAEVANRILKDYPDEEGAVAVLNEAIAGKEIAAKGLIRARELYAKALPRDKGVFDQEVLEWLREAAALAPKDPEIAALFEKISSYVRTIRVPEDYKSPAEALEAARDRDRVVIGKGDWKGPVVVNVSIEIQGPGAGSAVISCPANAGTAISFGPGAAGTHVSGITFRHESFDASEERFSAALVRGGNVTFSDCRFADASGHGLLVVESGQVSASRCKFEANGWNGVAAMGEGSLLEVRDSEVMENFGHGIEAWEGASVILSRNRCEANSRNGIHADGGTASATIEENQLVSNREFGLVLGSVASGRVAENVARGNLLGGLVIHSAAASVPVVANQAVKNDGPGLVLELGLVANKFTNNSASGNVGEQILSDADFSPPSEDFTEETGSEPEPAVVDPP